MPDNRHRNYFDAPEGHEPDYGPDGICLKCGNPKKYYTTMNKKTISILNMPTSPITKTKEEFLAWLQSLPPETKFCTTMRTIECPIAQFTGVFAAPEDTNFPTWVHKFIERYDANQSTSLSDAIQIAATL